MSGKLLAMDLNSTVGWARMQKGTGARFGTLVLTGPDLAWKLGQLLNWLNDSYAVEPFDALAFERPLLLRTDTVAKLEILYGCVGVCLAFAGVRKLPWCEVSVTDAKKALTGRAHATKEQMIFAARRFAGWRVENDHEADSCAVGLIAYDRLWKRGAA